MIRRLLANKTLRGFAHVMGGNAIVTLSQGVQFFLLARILGPTELGRIAAAVGVTAMLMPFSGMGAANVMVMRSSRDVGLLPLYLGNALGVASLSGTLLVGFAVVAGVPLLSGQVSVQLMLLFAASELLAAKMVDVCWQAFIAREQLHFTSIFLTVQSIVRLLAALLFAATVSEPSATDWGVWALASNTLVAAWVLKRTVSQVGRLSVDWALARRELGIGFSFAVGLSAKGFYTDADKIFLARYAGAELVGQYTMAYRIVQIALVPIRALSFALLAKMFRAGEGGVDGALRLTMRVSGPLLAFCGLLALGFYAGAPLLTLLAGPGYEESVQILRAMCLMPFLLAAQSMLHSTLSSSGHHRVAAISQAFAALTICVACLALIPTFSWRGAVASSYGAQLLLCLMMLAVLLRSRRGLPLAREENA